MNTLSTDNLTVTRDVQDWSGRTVVVFTATPAKGSAYYTLYRDSLGRLNLCPTDTRRTRHVGSTHFFETVEEVAASRKRLRDLPGLVRALGGELVAR